MERLNNILQPHVRASKIKLSYVEELFPDLKNNPYIVLHKNISSKQCLDGNRERSFDEQFTSSYDVDGSPLKYSFDNGELNDTILITRCNWQKEEESYLPLCKNDVSNALNICLEYLDEDDKTLPILALCDGKDLKQTRLIGTIVCNNWFTTLESFSIGAITVHAVRNECHKTMKEHLKFVEEHNIKKSMLNSFNLFGIKQEKIDWDKNVKDDFEGSINIETYYSSNLELDPRLSKNTLTVEINAGWKDSSLKELRYQFLLLVQYLSIIDECKKDIGFQNLIKFTTPYLKEPDVINEKLNHLLNGDNSFRKVGNKNESEIDSTNKINTEINETLLERVQNVFLRHDVDFTDLLWEILIETSEYPHMINYIETILNEILEHKFIPQVNSTNSTRFIKHISNIYHHETISHLLAGSVPLESVVDMGFEKLTRDYLYILKGVQLIDLHDVRQKLVNVSSGIFSTENYRKRLVRLAQIHICLECMLLIEAHLECPNENLQSIFAYVYKEFFSEQSPLQNYTELFNQFYTLTMPLSNAVIGKLKNKMDPTIGKTSFSSQSAASMLTTTIYYSKMPIFPTNIYPIDVNAQEEIVYGIKTRSSSIKYKELRNA